MSAKQAGPDPVSARTPEEFVALLREVRSASQLSFWEIQARAHDHGYDLEPAAVVHALGQPGLPDWQIVVGLLTSCGYQGMHIDRWMRVYHDLEAGQQFHEPAPHQPRHELGEEPDPVSVPPLPPMHRIARSTSNRRRYGVAFAVAAAVVVLTLLVVSMWDSDPEMVAGPGTSTTPAPQGSGPDAAQASPTPEVSGASPLAGNTAPAPGTQPSAAAPGVLRSGTVTLAGGQGVDLDTGQSGGSLDLIAASGTALQAGDNFKRLGLMSGMPSQQTCASLNTGHLDRDATGLATGQWLCVHTSSGHWARVNVTATGSSLKLAYTVWT